MWSSFEILAIRFSTSTRIIVVIINLISYSSTNYKKNNIHASYLPTTLYLHIVMLL